MVSFWREIQSVVTDIRQRVLTCRELAVDPDSVVALGPRSWRADAADGPVVLRYVPDDNARAQRAIATLGQARDGRFDLLQPLRRFAPCEGGAVAVLDWIPGTTLRAGDRHELPEFFERLAKWHRANTGTLPVYSPYTGLEYRSISAFLDDELAHHLDQLGTLDRRAACRSMLQPLAGGVTTYTHGDVHPGNILVQNDRAFVLLDPEYLHIGCNFLDLDYVDWLGLEPEPTPWWTIREHRRECISRYFASLGSPTDSIFAVMTAVCLLTALRSHSNALKHETGNSGEVRLRIEKILRGQEKLPGTLG